MREREIELLEKLVYVQGMHIELMKDYNNLKNCYKDLEEIKKRRIDDLSNTIEGQSKKIGALESENAELKKQIAELKKQYEELQKLIPIELVGKEQENQ